MEFEEFVEVVQKCSIDIQNFCIEKQYHPTVLATSYGKLLCSYLLNLDISYEEFSYQIDLLKKDYKIALEKKNGH